MIQREHASRIHAEIESIVMKKDTVLNALSRQRLVRIRLIVFQLTVKITKSLSLLYTNVKTAMITSIQMMKVETAFNAI
jgi:hypothetical protein